MQENIVALLVHDCAEPMEFVRRALEREFIETQSVKTCGEVAAILWGSRPPHLVFADPCLADGSWEDVIVLTEQAPVPANVIVVSEVVDIALYLEAIQRGAFDFIVPPLPQPDLSYVVRSAVENALRRRKAQAAISENAKSESGNARTTEPAGSSPTRGEAVKRRDAPEIHMVC